MYIQNVRQEVKTDMKTKVKYKTILMDRLIMDRYKGSHSGDLFRNSRVPSTKLVINLPMTYLKLYCK